MTSRPADMDYAPLLVWRRTKSAMFLVICAVMGCLGLVALAALIATIIRDGASHLSLDFLTNFPSMFPEASGVKSALHGSIWLVVITIVFSVPIGIGAAVYLEEFAPDNRLTRLIHLNISNLAGVPSIVFGLLGLTIFVRWSRFDRSIFSGGLTLCLLVLPVIIIASQEALLAVPKSFRLAAYALGATRWQTVRYHVLPVALPGMMTGIILALSRAIGEAAPLIIVGAIAYITFVPDGLKSQFTALPIQIYFWSNQPDPEFQNLAASASIVLLGVLIPLNAIAVLIRGLRQRKRAW